MAQIIPAEPAHVPTFALAAVIQPAMTRIMLSAMAVVALSVSVWAAQTTPSQVTARGEWTADARRVSSNDGERRIQLNLRTDGDGHWGSGVRVADLEGLPEAALSGMANDARFSWTREAGVFRFEGSFDRGRGAGSFTFAAQSAYVSGMAGLGYRNLTADDLLGLALMDVTQAYVRSLRDTGYQSIPLEDLVRMRIHRVTAEETRELQALGYKDLAIEDLVRFRIHKVTPDFIRGFQDRNYRGLRPEDLVKMRIHKVSVPEIDQLKSLGYTGLGADDLVKLRIHKVTPQFIGSIHDAGFRTISIEQLVRMRIHKVDAQFIKDLQAAGYRNLTAADVIEFAIRGPRFRRPGRS